MKRVVILFFALTLVFSTAVLPAKNTAFASDNIVQPTDIRLFVNGESVVFPDQQPVMVEGRTYVPVRFLVEALGASVEWDKNHQVATIINGGLQITEDENTYYSRYYIKVGEPQIVNVLYSKIFKDYTQRIEIFDTPQAPFVSDENRLMLPFRFVAEVLGAFVYYDDSKRTANVVFTEKANEETPTPVLSSLIQEYFRDELMKTRIAHMEEKGLKNPKAMNIYINDELMSAGTWKAIDLFKHYAIDHSNSDGTSKGTRFFELYMQDKYGMTPPYRTLECIKRTNFRVYSGWDFLQKANALLSVYKDVDVMAVLEDAEYWYQHLQTEWGLSLLPLTEERPVTVNGKTIEGFKTNPEYEHNSNPYYAFSVIHHWNETIYRAYAKYDINGWMRSDKHRSAVLSGARIFGYGTKTTHSGGYSAFLPGGENLQFN